MNRYSTAMALGMGALFGSSDIVFSIYDPDFKPRSNKTSDPNENRDLTLKEKQIRSKHDEMRVEKSKEKRERRLARNLEILARNKN